MSDSHRFYEAARAAEGDGQTSVAIRHYREVLRSEPDHTEALLRLGLLLAGMDEHEAARRCLERRLALMPDDAETEFQMGNVLLAAGEAEDALAHLTRASELAPRVPEVHGNLGTALLRLGRGGDAIEALRRAIDLRPEYPQALNALGNAHAQTGDAAAAIAAYERVLAVDPDSAEALVNLGHALREEGRLEEAMQSFTRALVADPGFVEAQNGVGMVLQTRHRHDKASAAFRRALDMDPGNLRVLNNLAISLQTLRRHGEALAIYRDVVARAPDLAEAQANLGHVLQGLGREKEAVLVFRKALALRPDQRSLAFYLIHALLHQCDWEDVESLVADALGDAEDRLRRDEPIPALPFLLGATPASSALRLAVARRVSTACEETVAAEVAALSFLTGRSEGERLRVGYLSPDFRTHSMGLSFLELLRAHDREGFLWHGYATTPLEEGDSVTAAYRAAFDSFTDASALSPAEIARRVNADRVQVLIDLAGHTRDARLEPFFFRPAPVQAHYLGDAATLGAACIPYLITDETHSPEEVARHCSEAMVYLPESFMATARPQIAEAAPSRAASGLPEGGVVLASFNAYYKLYPTMFDVWMRLLQRVRGSVLWLRAGEEGAMANLRREAERRGVAGDRLVFAPRLAQGEHLARHRLADVALDTLHHGGGVTTTDALWCGVPVVSLAGATASARIGASLLRAAGLPELVAGSLEEYESIAFDLASDDNARAAVKAKLREGRDRVPLFDMERLAHHLETAYRLMWQRSAAGEPPATIRVPALPRG